jgi:hypothetical protein
LLYGILRSCETVPITASNRSYVAEIADMAVYKKLQTAPIVHIAIRPRLFRQQANSDPAPNRFSQPHQFLHLQHAIYSLEPDRSPALQWNRELFIAAC